ncbi:TPA: helix-turn-helix domain-containing protein [Cronobacter sakazakii]|uniref:transcriptional regulator n=1 Tax=Enterobacteriaceae TaxID=543 RepID=UPI0009073159|nr:MULTISPECIES: YdaS family helix-turn-helix protein [Enterobacteriaceae]EGT5204829.1 Cro/Cl family transcriptional regulator [Cronobacter sakazakii]EGT5755606.1 Cro/Cl family transcriptional regulator [Cronobacter sakazakii]EIH9537420.1 helix-turn-helix domain-containing protein [Escherichia coli]EJG0817018.1 helix-turn-helix domain-containing protein [Cronobacter sakazakii]EJG2179651.1 helix-turn-helix domain-containing protein [Cronobacter sakazakii]
MTEDIRLRLLALSSQRAIAQEVGVSPQAVNQWLRKSTIPARFVLPVCAFVGWKITPHEIRPDLYPSSSDGVPPLVRAQV